MNNHSTTPQSGMVLLLCLMFLVALTLLGLSASSDAILQNQLAANLQEQERAKHQKHEALSYMASGIAHDFNNALMIIGGNMSLLKMEELSNSAQDIIDDYIKIKKGE